MPARLWTAAAVAAFLAVTPLPAATAAAAPTARSAAPGDPQEFLDTRLPELLADYGVPGLVATVVADGEQVALAGAGEFDTVEGRAVDPAEDSFAVGSLSKSFTALALLQLVDEGLVDLQEDVNTYLPEAARVPDTHPGEPVTPHHLLTHTAGFSDPAVGEIAFEREDLLPLAEHAARSNAHRAHPPGELVAYSNHGYNLAGLIVEEVSGQPFADYTAEHVFEPLGMDGTAFGRLHAQDGDHSVPPGHGGDGEPVVEHYAGGGPSGLAVATAPDMSRFMLALLNGGELDGTRVLSEESTAAMLDRQVGGAPGVTGLGYGTWETRLDAPRIVGHEGDLTARHAAFAIVPETGTGYFLAFNGNPGPDAPDDDLRTAFHNAFTEAFAPSEEEAPATSGAPDVPVHEGVYRSARRMSEGPGRLLELGSWMRVRTDEDGAVVTSGFLGSPQRWLPVGGGVYQEEDGTDRTGFFTTASGRDALSMDSLPTSAYERLDTWWRSPALHATVAVAALLVLLTVLVWPCTALVRVLRGRPAPKGSGAARWAAGLAAGGAFGLVAMAVVLMASSPELVSVLGQTGSVVLTVPTTAGAVFAVTASAATAVAWRRGWWSAAGRVHHTLVALAAVAFTGVAAAYGLIWPLL